jgi:asparagine synthase (glutamine-hydrolysing)
MCGIAGYISKEENDHEKIIQKITASFSYRGPDDSGFFLDKNNSTYIALGHRRLSIIDTSSLGHQPMQFNQFTLVFNGEIYNYKEIKQELQSLGHSFHSHSDSEVILHAFAQWKEKSVDKFIGMFAFAIYDSMEQKIHLYRDRAGVKPLYYYSTKELFVFSSELKGILAHPDFEKKLNQESAALFFKYGYVLGENAIFEGVKKLLPGHFLTLNLNNFQYKTKKYWEVLDYYNQPDLQIDYPEAKEEVRRLLFDAINYRMVADVPVGLFLSGGYDSSLVGGILKQLGHDNLETFTIGFEDKKYDESNVAKEIAHHLGFKNHQLICETNHAKEILPNLPQYYDEPFADVSSIPSILLSQFASKNVKVVLSADAGDEIFAGYDFYKNALNYQNKFSFLQNFTFASYGLKWAKKLIPNHLTRTKHNLEGLVNFIQSEKNNGSLLFHHLFSQKNNEKEVQKLFLDHLSFPKTDFDTIYSQLTKKDHWLNHLLAVDYKTYMVDNILTKVDRATMSASIEGREPLLDHRLVEFVSRLPESFKYNGVTQKFILKDICHDYIPKHIIDRPKQGFILPLHKWLRHELKDFTLEFLSAEKCKEYGVLSPEYVNEVKKQFFKGNIHFQDMAWQIITFNNWADHWLK